MRLFDTQGGEFAKFGKNSLVEPGDVKQGELGDCWLLGAIAAFAEVPGGIQNLFVNKEYSSKGKYTVRLYDALEKQWTRVTVDDWLPALLPSPQLSSVNPSTCGDRLELTLQDLSCTCVARFRYTSARLGDHEGLVAGNERNAYSNLDTQ
jgi:hypothetical protein